MKRERGAQPMGMHGEERGVRKAFLEQNFKAWDAAIAQLERDLKQQEISPDSLDHFITVKKGDIL